MNLLFLLLSAAAAYRGYKKKSALWFAGVGFLVALALSWRGADRVGYNLSLIVGPHLMPLLMFAIAGFVGFKIYLRVKGIKHTPGAAKKASASREQKPMKLLVGQVIDTKISKTVFSNVHVKRDSFGNVGSHTTHDVRTSHSTWLHDLNSDIEVNYSGTGSLEARSGHIVGTMSWNGTSFLDINYSTQKIFRKPLVSTNPIGSLLTGFCMTLLGWIGFPVFALVAPFMWRRGREVLSNFSVPGLRKMEAIYIYGGSAAYAFFTLVTFVLLEGGIKNLGVVGCVLLVLLAVNCFLCQYVAVATRDRQKAFMAEGEAKLDELYAAGMAKQAALEAARTTPAAATIVVEQVVAAT